MRLFDLTLVCIVGGCVYAAVGAALFHQPMLALLCIAGAVVTFAWLLAPRR